MAGDVLSIENETHQGDMLIRQYMKAGRRTCTLPAPPEIRKHATHELERLPETLRRLEPGTIYPVHVSDSLVRLAAEVDERLKAARDTGI